jgi:circadian clock protein KaiB
MNTTSAPHTDHGDDDAAIDGLWQLRLYVAGESQISVRAYGNLKKLCEAHLDGRFEIEIVDLVEHPELARSDGIVAVPTLVRRRPLPLRKVIGDLSNTEDVIDGLRLRLDQPG